MPDIDIIDPSVFASGVLEWYRNVAFSPQSTIMYPGEDIAFGWLPPVSTPGHWVAADIEIVLVVGSDEQHLWSHAGIHWPPTLVSPETADSIWPPVGWVADVLRPVGGSRAALFSGLGDKRLRFKVRGRDTVGNTHVLTADAVVTLVAFESAVAVSILAPASANWNTPYSVSGTVRNGGPSAIETEITVASDDGSSFPTITVHIPARSTVPVTFGGPTTQNWQWVDKPTYHVRAESVMRRFTYTPTVLLVVDEFGNNYPPTPQQAASVVVIVSDSKRHDANMSEANFWWSVALTTGAAVSGGLAAIPFLTAIFAPLAAGAAVEAIYFASVAVSYAQLADDPPSPDSNFWSFAPTPIIPVLPVQDDLGPLTKMLVAAWLLAQLRLSASVTVGRILGARLAGADIAEQAQTVRFCELRREIVLIVQGIPALIEPALSAIAGYKALDPQQVAAQLNRWSSAGLKADESAAIQSSLGKDLGSQFAAILTDPSTPKRIPTATDLVTLLGICALQSAGTGIEDLRRALGPKTSDLLVACQSPSPKPQQG